MRVGQRLSMVELFCRIPAAPSCSGRSARVELPAGRLYPPQASRRTSVPNNSLVAAAEADMTCAETMNSYVGPEQQVRQDPFRPLSAMADGAFARVGISTESCSLS